MFRYGFVFLMMTIASVSHGQAPTVVQRITEIDFTVLLSQPPHLVVTVKGIVPSAGFTDTRLLRAQYIQPPADGIQDLFLMSTPPSGPAAAVLTEVSASDTIRRYTEDYPWLRGVRVHGVGSGVMTKMLNSSLRVRKNILDLSPTELASFRQGVQVMKSRPANDPRSWSFQANIHGENTPASNPLWNQCQHGSLHFFTWHRAYLLEFERILRDASGDSNFTLPYWDWSTSRALPSVFRDPASPLFEPGRSINGGQLLPTSVVVDDFTDTINSIAFSDFSFGLEGSPHGSVHVLIGGRMASVPTAANDPIFWLHHCNIDRAWDSWLALGGGRANPSDAAFLNRTFTLVGQSGATEVLRVGDLLDSAALGYRYSGLSGLSPSTPPLAPEPGFQEVAFTAAATHDEHDDGHGGNGEKKAIKVASSASVAAIEALTTDGPPAKPLGLAVERVELQSSSDGAAAMRTAVAEAAPAADQRIFIDVIGLSAKETPRFTFTIYLNLPLDTEQGKIAEEVKKLHRVGTLNFFGLADANANEGDHAHAAHAHDSARQRFDATQTIAKLREAGLWKEGKYNITLEPITPIATQGEDPALKKLLSESAEAAKLTYERIDLSVSGK